MAGDLILRVDKNDKVIGEVLKEKAHQGKGILHRAFLAMVFNNKNQFLLAKRSEFKKLWPGFWDGTVASHFKRGEGLKRAVKRRIIEELGVEPKKIKYLFKIDFATPFRKNGIEKEICYIFKTRVGSKISPNLKEVFNWKWVNLSKINSKKLTPWLLLAIKKYGCKESN